MLFQRTFPKFTYPEETRKVIKYFLDNPTFVLTPEQSPTHTVYYPALSKITGLPQEKAMVILKELVENRWVEPQIYGNIPSCPKCGSLQIAISYFCPYCGSSHIVSGPVIKHITCGFTGFVSDFQEMDTLICPNCETQLEIKDIGKRWTAPGIWYECNSCHKFFEHPKINAKCIKCGATFPLEEAKLISIFSYTLNPYIVNTAIEFTGMFSKIIEIVAIKGWEVSYPAVIKGTTPAPHEFTMQLKYQDKFNCVIDILYSPKGKVDSPEVLNFSSKAMDVDVTDRVIIAIPDATEAAYDTALSFKIEIITAENISDAIKKLAAWIDSKTQKTKDETVKEEASYIERFLESFK